MSGEACPREDELLEALGRGFTGPELAAHVAACPSCRELAAVAAALLDDRALAMAEAPVPSAGTMWLRLQARRRHEAAARAHRSLLLGQAATLLVALGLVIAFFGGEVRDLVAAIRMSTPLLLAAATLLVAPIAGWVALRSR